MEAPPTHGADLSAQLSPLAETAPSANSAPPPSAPSPSSSTKGPRGSLKPFDSPGDHKTLFSWRKWFGKEEAAKQEAAKQEQVATLPPPLPEETIQRPGLGRRLSRKVIPGLPRPGTFKRQLSELRNNLEPTRSNPVERRAVSVDRRQKYGQSRQQSRPAIQADDPRLSAPGILGSSDSREITTKFQHVPEEGHIDEPGYSDIADISERMSHLSEADMHSDVGDGFDEELLDELERSWILNLSMHFRDRSNREKFFVTYAEKPSRWRRVTISLDYRDAPPDSLEDELQQMQFQRDKSARIYESIRESLPDIQFYDTVTNLKLQTEQDRLHVHVTEDIHEVINYPPVSAIAHLQCRRIREDALIFDSHLSGFVYKVKIDNHVYIKKEIPGPDTVDEFLYEINALHRLTGSGSVIEFIGVVVDNEEKYLKGLVISYAENGALIDVLYDGQKQLSWSRRERWAKQIVQGLSEIHEAGFVQGDFTLSNIVVDEHDNAKIIDINRRGCPVGWEPPEIAALLASKQRISMYIGVKSDMFQLGMVLWAIAMQQDEPELQPRPLNLENSPDEIPVYFREIVGVCLSDNPKDRSHASSLLTLFPDIDQEVLGSVREVPNGFNHPEVECQDPIATRDIQGAQYIDPGTAVNRDDIDNYRVLSPQSSHRIGGQAHSSGTHTYVNAPTDVSGDGYFYAPRGRSLPPQSSTSGPFVNNRASNPDYEHVQAFDPQEPQETQATQEPEELPVDQTLEPLIVSASHSRVEHNGYEEADYRHASPIYVGTEMDHRFGDITGHMEAHDTGGVGLGENEAKHEQKAPEVSDSEVREEMEMGMEIDRGCHDLAGVGEHSTFSTSELPQTLDLPQTLELPQVLDSAQVREDV